jgi:hypothetical protein
MRERSDKEHVETRSGDHGPERHAIILQTEAWRRQHGGIPWQPFTMPCFDDVHFPSQTRLLLIGSPSPSVETMIKASGAVKVRFNLSEKAKSYGRTKPGAVIR